MAPRPVAGAGLGLVVDVVEVVVVVALGPVVVVGVDFGPVGVEVVGGAGAGVGVVVDRGDVVVVPSLECAGFGFVPQADSTTTNAIKQAPRRTAASYRALADTWVETGPVPTPLTAATS